MLHFALVIDGLCGYLRLMYDNVLRIGVTSAVLK